MFLEQMDLPMSLNHWEFQTTQKVITALLFQVIGLPKQCLWQIKKPECYLSLTWHPLQSPIAK